MLYRPSRLLGLCDGTIESTADEHRCKVRFSADEAFFVGHFPGRPVVPGVIMIEGLIALIEKTTASRRLLSHVDEAKFRSEAHPNDELTYVMTRIDGGYRADIRCGDRDILNARLRLAEC
jgi:3-hydroxymyristoyl/3-hydroxydecanoyl-(acyl carrier protein) dehydratase